MGKKTDYNTKITEIEGNKISISGVATTAALTAVQSKIPDVSKLVKQWDYDAKIPDIECKYYTMLITIDLQAKHSM